MGFFSGLGKAIGNVAKAISLKNVVNVATGNAGAVVKEVVDRAKNSVGMLVQETIGKSVKTPPGNPVNSGVKTTMPVRTLPAGALVKPSALVKANVTPAKTQFAVATGNLSVTKSGSTGVPAVDNALNQFAENINEQVKTATGKVLQKPEIKSILDWFEKSTIEYYWEKHKTKIIVAGVALIGFLVYWFKFRKPKRGRRR